jgi:hypothetical protein
MKKHLYNTKLGKLKWFIKRFGFFEFFMKPLRIAFAPIIVKLKRKRTFIFNNKKHKFFYHKYNTTWANERCVEIPIVREFIGNTKEKILEVGNVLSHYQNVDWSILDKFEKGKGVVNKDIASFKPGTKYKKVISISTFEHIGYDDDSPSNSTKKIINAFNNLQKNCLKKGGTAIITVPLGYNPKMDEIVFRNKLKFKEIKFVKKVSRNDWEEVSSKDAKNSKYGRPYSYANCVAIGIYKN